MNALLKKIPIGLGAIAMILSVISCKERKPIINGYTIDGTVNGLDQGWAYLIENDFTDRSGNNLIDSAKIEKGTFHFKGSTAHRDMVNLRLNDTYGGRFFLENSPIQVNIDLEQADKYGQFIPEVIGSKSNDSLLIAQAEIDKIFNAPKFKLLDDTRAAYTEARNAKNDSLMASLLAQMEEPSYSTLSALRQQELKAAKMAYMEAHPNSPIAINILGFQFSESRMNNDEMEKMLAVIDGDAKGTAFYNYYTTTYDQIYATLGVGGTAPDFTLTTLEGTPLTLSTVDAKYKLVDFWASWCVPCRASFPHLKERYKQYNADGFEVVGIGTADEKEKWAKAIEVDQTPWKHVFDTSETEGKNQYGNVSLQYSVPFLPTTFLLDADNTILLRNPSRKELDAKLAELFGH